MDRWQVLSGVRMIVTLLLPLIIFLCGSGKHWRAAQEKPRKRRMTEDRMNARLLRLDI